MTVTIWSTTDDRDPGAATSLRCHCGYRLEPCRDCAERRCLRCDPYRSEDCFT